MTSKEKAVYYRRVKIFKLAAFIRVNAHIAFVHCGQMKMVVAGVAPGQVMGPPGEESHQQHSVWAALLPGSRRERRK